MHRQAFCKRVQAEAEVAKTFSFKGGRDEELPHEIARNALMHQGGEAEYVQSIASALPVGHYYPQKQAEISCHGEEEGTGEWAVRYKWKYDEEEEGCYL